MAETVLLTGSTGLLGSYLIEKFIRYDIGNIVALSRGRSQEEAEKRVYDTLGQHFSLKGNRKKMPRIEVVRGDIVRKNLGMPKSVYDKLSKTVTSIYHSAALCDFNVPLEPIREVNVGGTENVLKFASRCARNSRFKGLHHISTIAVGGKIEGVFHEEELDEGQGFNNTYEQTKFEAEQLVLKYRAKGVPVSIYRPAIITGDTRTGYTNNFKMFYQPLQIFSLNLFKEIPADKNTPYSLVPVDYVAEAITRISLDGGARNSTYHITNPNEVTLRYFVEKAAKYFKFQKPLLIPKEKFDFGRLTPLQLSLLDPYLPYFNYKLRFDASRAESILRKTHFKWPVIDEALFNTIFDFCVHSKFIAPKGKSKPQP